MTTRRISRRTVLRGLGGHDGAAPARHHAPRLRARRERPGGARRGGGERATARLPVLPERDRARLVASAAETGPDGRLVKLNEWMRPFEPFKDELIVPRNVWTPLGNGHVGGTPTWLTGFDYDRQAVSAGGVSADQIAGRHVGAGDAAAVAGAVDARRGRDSSRTRSRATASRGRRRTGRCRARWSRAPSSTASSAPRPAGRATAR